jgi:hypothetical protein
MATAERFPMKHDRVVGDGGNLTVYERPDRSRYALDKRGFGQEYETDSPIFGRARFDSRAMSSGSWEGSRSEHQHRTPAENAIGAGPRRRRGWSRS